MTPHEEFIIAALKIAAGVFMGAVPLMVPIVWAIARKVAGVRADMSGVRADVGELRGRVDDAATAAASAADSAASAARRAGRTEHMTQDFISGNTPVPFPPAPADPFASYDVRKEELPPSAARTNPRIVLEDMKQLPPPKK